MTFLFDRFHPRSSHDSYGTARSTSVAQLRQQISWSSASSMLLLCIKGYPRTAEQSHHMLSSTPSSRGEALDDGWQGDFLCNFYMTLSLFPFTEFPLLIRTHCMAQLEALAFTVTGKYLSHPPNSLFRHFLVVGGWVAICFLDLFSFFHNFLFPMHDPPPTFVHNHGPFLSSAASREGET